MMQAINDYFPWILETNEVHLRCSALSGVMEGVIQALVSGGGQTPDNDQQAEAARLLAGFAISCCAFPGPPGTDIFYT